MRNKDGFNFLKSSWLDDLVLFLQFDIKPEMKYAKQLRGIKKF